MTCFMRSWGLKQSFVHARQALQQQSCAPSPDLHFLSFLTVNNCCVTSSELTVMKALHPLELVTRSHPKGDPGRAIHTGVGTRLDTVSEAVAHTTLCGLLAAPAWESPAPLSLNQSLNQSANSCNKFQLSFFRSAKAQHEPDLRSFINLLGRLDGDPPSKTEETAHSSVPSMPILLKANSLL